MKQEKIHEKEEREERVESGRNVIDTHPPMTKTIKNVKFTFLF